MQNLIVIMLIFFVFYRYSTPTHINVDMRAAYRNSGINCSETAKKELEQVKKKYDEDLAKYKKAAADEKKRADMLTTGPYTQTLYFDSDDYPLTGDDKLTFRMQELGKKNKQALTNRALWTKNSFAPYIEEELRDHENSVWYEDDRLENFF